MQRFIEAFQKRYGHPPNSFSAAGYAAVQLVRDVAAVGGSDSVKIKEALYRTDLPTVFGQIRYDANGDNVGATYGLFQLDTKDQPVLVK